MTFGITPQFTYNPGSGNVTLTPTYPPTGKPLASEMEATRHDSITSSGIKQSIVERIDNFVTLNFPFVPLADIAAWTAFMQWALAGGVFTYTPDSTVPAVNAQYTLEDTSWNPKRATIGHATFSFRMRQYV